MKLRAVVEEDYADVVALANAAYRTQGDGASWNSEAGVLEGTRLTMSSLREDLAKPGAELLVWRDEDGLLMGTVFLQPKEDGVWYLGLLTVRPGGQNRGAGKELLAKAEAYVKSREGKRVRMTVLAVRETLISWYQRRGYRETGVTEAFPYGDERFGRPLRDDLYFVVLEKELLDLSHTY
jgi:ribosomal protein S18 acetylase RimI-like enzyme